MLANIDSVDITMIGRGGHGAYPHTTIDPIVLAAAACHQPANDRQPRDQAHRAGVITVGSIHGGTKHNIIGDNVTCS